MRTVVSSPVIKEALLHSPGSDRNRPWKGICLSALLIGVALWTVALAASLRPADFNGNGRVDSDDLFDFGYYFGLERGEELYETEGYRADFDQNGRVDELDLFYFASHWHKD